MVQLDFIVMGVFALLIFAIGLTFTRVGSKNGQAFFEGPAPKVSARVS